MILQPVSKYERQKSDLEVSRIKLLDLKWLCDKQSMVWTNKVLYQVLNILLPIYNDAYSDKGLNAGTNYVNKSEVDSMGTIKPIMGKVNGGLAAHNFTDGKQGLVVYSEKSTIISILTKWIVKKVQLVKWETSVVRKWAGDL